MMLSVKSNGIISNCAGIAPFWIKTTKCFQLGHRDFCHILSHYEQYSRELDSFLKVDKWFLAAVPWEMPVYSLPA